MQDHLLRGQSHATWKGCTSMKLKCKHKTSQVRMHFSQCESVALYGMSMHAVTPLTVSLYQLRLKPQLFFVFVVDTEAASHPAISMPH